MTSSRLVAPELATIKVKGMTRESFLMRATLAAGATYGALSATPYITKAIAQGDVSDLDIVNYALTLEYLEAEFYTQGLKEVSGLSGDEKKLATELRDNEKEHVSALMTFASDLGGEPAKKPEFDFSSAYGSRQAFFKTSNTLEDTGVSAYNGAGPLVESGDVLMAAGQIVQVEARHAALIRLLRNAPPAPRAFDEDSPMDEVVDKITPFIVS